MARTFSRKQKTALYLAAGGQCSICGEDLLKGWEADHIKPWSAGGDTDVINGQALCPRCNRKKGVQIMRPWPASFSLYKWQEKFRRQYREHRPPDFLLVATPGGGKTRASLQAIHDRFEAGHSSRVVIVCHSDYLKLQWAADATQVGIHLDPKFSGPLTKDFHGVVATYAQVESSHLLFRKLCAESNTFVVLDEIHHAGEEKPWGDSIRLAFDHADRRLLLSGTPFRTGPEPIPFVTYVDGRSRPDFVYSYADALADGVCRRVFFPSFETRATWRRHGKEKTASFADPLGEQASRERLRTVLQPTSDWMGLTLKEAHQQLSLIRREDHPNAGGLVVAKDIYHAGKIAQRLTEITGELPVLVTSNEGDAAADAIKVFAESSRPWIVAVKMVSEGVDIKRLRVAVYATNILTEMYFRQVVGRIVRVIKGLESQDAYMFIPADPILVEFAEQIMEERDHQLEEEIEKLLGGGAGGTGVESDYNPISADGMAHDTIIETDRVSIKEKQKAEQLCRKHKFPTNFDPTLMALAMRDLAQRENVQPDPSSSAIPPIETPSHQLRNRLRKVVSTLARRLAFLTYGKASKEHFQEIYTMLKRMDGASQDTATIEQFKRRIEYLERKIKETVKRGESTA